MTQDNEPVGFDEISDHLKSHAKYVGADHKPNGSTEPPDDMQSRFDEHRERFGATPVRQAFLAGAEISKPILASEIEENPAPRLWLVPELIPHGTVTMLGGDGGTGKSLLALQLAVAVATDGGWMGKQVTHGSVVYLSAEDTIPELSRRLVDIRAVEQLEMADMERLLLWSLVGEKAMLTSTERNGLLAETDIYAKLLEYLTEFQPTLLVLDTLADLFPGNENDRAQARQFVSLLNGLAMTNDCAILLLSHPSLSGLNTGTGTSGSTGWNNSVRSRLYLERVKNDDYEADPDARVLSTKKSNYGRTGGETQLTWKDGVFVSVEVETGLDRMSSNAKSERVFMSLLRMFSEQKRTVNHSGGSTYAPNVFAEHPDAEGCTKRSLKAAMERLFSQDKIKVSIQGPPSKRRNFLEVS